jgi:hypothetical protein
LIRQLREVNPAVKIVAMTGVTSMRHGLAEAAGKLKFLRKPMGVPEILEAVAAMCAGKPA